MLFRIQSNSLLSEVKKKFKIKMQRVYTKIICCLGNILRSIRIRNKHLNAICTVLPSVTMATGQHSNIKWCYAFLLTKLYQIVKYEKNLWLCVTTEFWFLHRNDLKNNCQSEFNYSMWCILNTRTIEDCIMLCRRFKRYTFLNDFKKCFSQF